MRRLLWLFALLLFSPFSLAAQDMIIGFRGYQPYSKNISFTYDRRIADTAFERLSSYNAPAQFTEIHFMNYILGQGSFDTGDYIRVYPTVEFGEGSYRQWEARLHDALDRRLDIGFPLPSIPYVGGLASIADVEFLDFQNGSGVRFTGTVDSLGSLYTFQGLTADSAYYIAAWFKLADPSLIPSYDALFTSLSVASPKATFIAQAGVVEAEYEGVSFAAGSELARRIEVSEFAALIADPQENLVGSTPDYIEFLVFGYPVESVAQFPRLIVQHVETFAPNSPSAEELERLQAVITAHEPLQSRNFFAPGIQQPLPLLPLIPKPQTYILHPAWLDFNGGSGYRFIACYSQNIEQIMDYHLFYVFQGMTDDGAQAIAALFPIHTSALPDRYDPSISMMETGMYDAYLQATFDALQADTNISPSLVELDAIIESLYIE